MGSSQSGTERTYDAVVVGAGPAGSASAALLATRPDTFPDALAASSLSGGLQSPIYLTDSGTEIGDGVIDGILAYPTPAYAAFLLGGPAALNDDVFTAFQVLLASQAG